VEYKNADYQKLEAGYSIPSLVIKKRVKDKKDFQQLNLKLNPYWITGFTDGEGHSLLVLKKS